MPQEIVLVPQQFDSVQAAIDATAGPVSIVVQPGVYDESIRLIDKEAVVIQSARLSRRGVTFAGRGGSAVFEVRRSSLHLSGIAVRSDSRLRGIDAEDSLVNLQECLVAGNRAGGEADEPFGAGLLCRRSRVHLQKSAIIANVIHCASDAAASGAGIHLDSCDAEIAGCTIQANAVYASGRALGGGLYLAGVKLRMWRSRVTDNLLLAAHGEGGGVCVVDPRRTDFGGCVVSGNDCSNGSGGGIFIRGHASEVSVHRNSFVRQNHPTDIESE